MTEFAPRTPYDVPITVADHAVQAGLRAITGYLAEHDAEILTAVVALRVENGPADELECSVTSVSPNNDSTGRHTVALLLGWADRVAHAIGEPIRVVGLKGGPSS